MSHKKLTDEELFAQFEDIPSTEAPSTSSTSTRSAKASKAAPPPPLLATPAVAVDDDDPLAELSALAAARPTSRPTTPRHSSTTTSSTGTKRADHTPASSGPPSNRTSEDRLRTTAAAAPPRKSTDSTRSNLNQSFVADDVHVESERESSQPAASGGGWWGSVFNVATAAVKQAEAAVKEIRGNEEVLKYAEQMKGNAKILREYGMLTFVSPHNSSSTTHIQQEATSVLSPYPPSNLSLSKSPLPSPLMNVSKSTPPMTYKAIPPWTLSSTPSLLASCHR